MPLGFVLRYVYVQANRLREVHPDEPLLRADRVDLVNISTFPILLGFFFF
jgi:hypothetical protein